MRRTRLLRYTNRRGRLFSGWGSGKTVCGWRLIRSGWRCVNVWPQPLAIRRSTFLGFRRRSPWGQVGLLEGSPFEVLFVASALHLPSLALLTGWFNLITFQSFGLAGDTAYRDGQLGLETRRMLAQILFHRLLHLPLRLFVCFGFCVLPEFPRLGLSFKIVDGDGILMLSIPS